MSIEIQELLSLNLSDRIILRNLPPSLADMARVIGVEATIKIVHEYGGRKLYIRPNVESSRKSNKIIDLIGKENAAKLIEHYANGFGANLTIHNSLFGRTLKRLKALAMLENGVSMAETANKMRVSPKTIQIWKKKYLETE